MPSLKSSSTAARSAEMNAADVIESTWNHDPRTKVIVNGKYTLSPAAVVVDQFLTFGDLPFGKWEEESSSPTNFSICPITISSPDHPYSPLNGMVRIQICRDLAKSGHGKSACLYFLDQDRKNVQSMHTIVLAEQEKNA